MREDAFGGYDGPSPIEERRYQRQLEAHPDCRDPDHPGCEVCKDCEVDDE
jgi:hypothetical protein